MKAGHESRTAVAVCAGRAMVHGRTPVTRFEDPTALLLLPEDVRRRVERLRGDAGALTVRDRIQRPFLDKGAKAMVARTVAIDDAVRAAGAPQLVILGAGLDGRAWRMPELREVTVFEVDHPDSQRAKRARAAALKTVAREVRFVPVDFERGRLNDALSAAGHDPSRPTTWIWEGVIMYLAQADIEATLRVVEARSAPESRLLVLYLTPSRFLTALAFLGRLTSEALRSVFDASQMRAMLGRFGFDVTEDRILRAIADDLGDDVRGMTWMLEHLRLVTARRVAPGA